MPAHDVTALLIDRRGGDHGAVVKRVPLVHGELRRLARRHMAGERPGHVLQATAVVNEVYLRLVDIRGVQWQDRAHFFAMAARMMRRVLVDFARARRNQKRGGRLHRVTFDQDMPVVAETPDDLIVIDDALQALTVQYERKGQVVELRLFGRAQRRGGRGSSADLPRNGDEGLEVREELADARAVSEETRSARRR